MTTTRLLTDPPGKPMNEPDLLDTDPDASAGVTGVTGATGANRQRPPRVSVVVPCHNEARNLEALLPRLAQCLSALVPAWEVVLVDDGSTDTTAQVLRDWSGKPGFRMVQLSRNFGKEAALTAGFEHALGDVVVSMDADLQHPPELIESMLRYWSRGADVVYAVRASREDETALKRLGTRLFYRLVNGFERVQIPPGGGDFRLLDRAALDALLSLPERNRFMKGLYAWVGFDAVALPYMPDPRAHGTSHFSLGRLLSLFLDGLTAFTTWPLRLATGIGVVTALTAIGYGAWRIASYLLWGNDVDGWTTIVVGGSLMAGVQMILIGIMGEYIGRIFEEVKGRPVYLVKHLRGQGLTPKA